MKKSIALALAALLLAFSTPLAASAAVTVVINGRTMNFAQPPVERSARVFVPLRGIFEALGATVNYSNGLIDATGSGRSVQLHLGSQQATVNGQATMVDVAPFLIGNTTMVPLRFIAQALGASVLWDGSSQTVTINGNGGSYNSVPNPTAPPNNNASFYLTDKRPGSSTTTLQPAIHARFSEPVQRDTIRVRIDGNDVTNDVYANANGFDVTPSSQLSAGNHRVQLTGTTQAGANFRTGWTFTTSNGATQNYLRALSPNQNAQIGSSFNLSGQTLPNSHVHVVASGEAAALGGLFQIGTGTYQNDVTADGNGYFSVNIPNNVPHGGQLRVVVQSTSPSGASVERSLTYNI